MKSISEKNRLKAGLAIASYLAKNPLEAQEKFPNGTTFTPVGTEDGQLLVAVEPPADGVAEALQRVPCIA